MTDFVCERCNHDFKSKSRYQKHLLRKKPCKPVLTNDGDVDNIDSLINKVENLSIKNLNPLVKWSGGKKDEIQKILEYIPSCYDTYIEPFVGGGALFFHLEPKKSVIADVHVELIDFYVALKEGHADDIYKFMQQNKNDEETYYKVRSLDPKDKVENAKRFYYLRKTCFRGMMRYNKKGEFNIPYGRYKSCNFDDLLEERYLKVLKNSEIFCTDFEKIFEKYNNSSNFMFLDPPYDSEFTDYGYCKFGVEEHERLAECFKKTKIKCLMVIGKTPLIQKLYKDYIVPEYQKNYRFRLHSGRVGNEIDNMHLVIKNF